MPSFKVSRNGKVYKKGVADELVEQGCYAIDIHLDPDKLKGSDHRSRQRTSVQIGDTLYMVRGKNYWVGTVTSNWLQMPMHNGKYHPFGFFHSVKGKRKYQLDAFHDEWVCKVNWGPKTCFPPNNTPNVDDSVEELMDMNKWLDEGFNAITIKPLPSRAAAAYVIRERIRKSKKLAKAAKKEQLSLKRQRSSESEIFSPTVDNTLEREESVITTSFLDLVIEDVFMC